MSQSSGNALSNLIDAARRAARAGRTDEAARAWDQVRAAAPDHPEALYFFAQRSLAQGDARSAVPWLQRAVQSSPQPVIFLGLAHAHQMLGDDMGQMNALEGALKADPYCYPALLSKGALLEKMGFPRQSARTYADALKILPREERLAPDLRALAERARKAVGENTEALDAFIQRRLSDLRAAHAAEPLERFDEAKDAMTGRKKIYVQQPVMLHYPRLPAIQFYEDARFPWLKDLESETDAIEAELQGVLAARREGFRPYLNHPDGVPLNEIGVLNRSMDWSAYFLWDDGKRIDEHCERCPRTAALLDTLPLAHVPGFAPAAFFSNLKPRAKIPAHTGVTNARLIVHLGLIVPGRCTFRVGNETREWTRGKAWVFDDSIEHEAANDSDAERVVFIFDVWNPYLSVAERELVCALLAAQREYYAQDRGAV